MLKYLLIGFFALSTSVGYVPDSSAELKKNYCKAKVSYNTWEWRNYCVLEFDAEPLPAGATHTKMRL